MHIDEIRHGLLNVGYKRDQPDLNVLAVFFTSLNLGLTHTWDNISFENVFTTMLKVKAPTGVEQCFFLSPYQRADLYTLGRNLETNQDEPIYCSWLTETDLHNFELIINQGYTLHRLKPVETEQLLDMLRDERPS